MFEWLEDVCLKWTTTVLYFASNVFICEVYWCNICEYLSSINSDFLRHTLQKTSKNPPSTKTPIDFALLCPFATPIGKDNSPAKTPKKDSRDLPRRCLSQQRDFVPFVDWSSVRVGYDSSCDSAFDHGGNICRNWLECYLKSFWCNRCYFWKDKYTQSLERIVG